MHAHMFRRLSHIAAEIAKITILFSCWERMPPGRIKSYIFKNQRKSQRKHSSKDDSLGMEGKEPTPSENPTHEASSSSTSPHIGDYGGRTKKPEGNDHDVFLSCETRRNLLIGNDLRNSLVDAGIDTFYVMDRSKKEIGSEVLKSLMQSKISIPIISRSYISDKLLLRELVHMLKCKRSSGQIVLPIFLYRVTPSGVQRVEGRFKEALSRHEHEGRVDETELGEWRKALAEVRSLRGWEADEFDGPRKNFEALIKLVVARVVSLLKKTFKFPKELVGIDDHETGIMSSIDPKCNDTRLIGIYGVHGSGKTTLAKVLWNRLSCDFEHRSFIPNIRVESRRMGIEYLQEELICDILRSQRTVSNVDEGIVIIKSQFSSKKILVILDDVDDQTHLNALFEDGSWLKAGSIIIITTRHKSILDKANADPEYELDELTQDQALNLFSGHFLGKDSPPKAYEEKSRDVISGIRRIPLILELIGSSFRQIREEEWEKAREKVWEETFIKLQEEVNNKNDEYMLHITYESLHYEQQQIFLDIACFFIGLSKQNPTYMWDSYGFSPKKRIKELRDICLIEIDKDEKLIMRDNLRNFGREIVRREDRKRIQKQSRLWHYEESLDVLARNKGTDMIQAICLDKYDSNRSYTSENFKGLTHLRFLKVCGANFTGDFENVLSELRYLHWERCPSNFVAANFHPQQLVVLDLSGGEISEDWGGWGPIKMATKLKVLNLSSCPHLKRIPDLTAFKSLEILILEKCENLEGIHPSIGDNKSLISFNVSGCGRVEELPIGVGRLEELKELLINYTAIQEIPMSEDGLMKLEILHASGCRNLKELPTEVGCMKELRELLINDTAIQEIPISGDGLWKLKTLCASYCEELSQLSESMGSLTSLTQLDLSHSEIEELPESLVFLKSLTRVDLSYTRIEKLSKSLDSLVLLTQLDLSHSGIREVPESISSLESLTLLDLSHTGIEELPKSMHSLKGLTYLNLSYVGIEIVT
ncbi:hypothetical protein BT93_C0834 [Corymbia citriodora subsp. variegata]|nr:hypothetical protein BT93_C0834 [Corymbia citriodora subsp. variegata]